MGKSLAESAELLFTGIVSEAMEKSTGEREGFIGEKCGKDLELRREVETLLAHLVKADTEAFLEGLPVKMSEEPTSDLIDGYEILECIGHGGQGAVYRARSCGVLKKVVAIKIIRSDLRTEEILRRFRQELRIYERLAEMRLEDLDVHLVLDFLNYLETQRANSIRTRNARLAAIKSFMKYVSYREPTSLPLVQKVLAIPTKRFHKRCLGFLSREEIEAILEAPDPTRWSGQRDRVMFKVFYNTGGRVSEIIGMKTNDLQLERVASVQIHGKGRKDRVVPLWKSTANLLKRWLMRRTRDPEAFLFPNRTGGQMSIAGVEDRLRIAVNEASRVCAGLKNRRITPHTIRHTTAMHLLQSGVDTSVIALWLGHESPETTHAYVEADLAMKERALKKVREVEGGRIRYRAGDKLLCFLEGL